MLAEAMNYTVVINFAVWGGAMAYYYIDARKWFTGPKITIDSDDLTDAQVQALKEEGLDVTGLDRVNRHGVEGGAVKSEKELVG